MAKDNSNLNIYQKLAKIGESVEVMQKNTKAYGYNYVKEEDILAKITGLMKKYEISLIPGICHGTLKVEPYHYLKTKVTNKGEVIEEHVNEVLVSADTTWTWVNNAMPDEQITVSWTMVGQQSDASQSFGSGLTYSSRYFLLKYFNVATSNDDPDNWRSKQREAEEAEARAIAEGLIAEFDLLLREYLAKNEEASEEVKTYISKFIKSGNYTKITDPKLAKTLLEGFKATYLTKEEKGE